jgi:hypothetical protein
MRLWLRIHIYIQCWELCASVRCCHSVLSRIACSCQARLAENQTHVTTLAKVCSVGGDMHCLDLGDAEIDVYNLKKVSLSVQQ